MANIPTIPGTQAVESPQLGVKIDPRAGLQANTAFGEAIETAANVVSAYEEKKQKITDITLQNQASLTLRSATDNFRHEVATGKYTPDEIPKQWEQVRNSTFSQINENLTNASPEAKQAINYHMEMSGHEIGAEFQAAADSLQIKNAINSARAIQKRIEITGDSSSITVAEAAYRQLVKQNVIPQSEMDVYMTEMKQEVSRSEIKNGINNDDPLTVIKAYNGFKAGEIGRDVPEAEKTTLLSKFRTRIKQNQTDQLRTLQEDHMNAGISYDAKYLQTLESQGLLRPRAASDYLRWQNGKVDTQAEAATVKFLRDKIYEIANNPALSDRQVEDAITDLKATPQYGSLHAPFVSDLDKTLGDIKSVKTKTEGKAHDYLNSYLNTGKLGDRDVLTNRPAPDSIKRFQQVFDLFKADYAKHPEWTYDDITKHIDGLVKKSVTGRQSKDLTSLITGQVQE